MLVVLFLQKSRLGKDFQVFISPCQTIGLHCSLTVLRCEGLRYQKPQLSGWWSLNISAETAHFLKPTAPHTALSFPSKAIFNRYEGEKKKKGVKFAALLFCILIRCLVTLHGSPASWHSRVLLNVLENNLVLGPAASLSLLVPGSPLWGGKETGKSRKGTELGIARLLLHQQLPPCCCSTWDQLGKAVLCPPCPNRELKSWD